MRVRLQIDRSSRTPVAEQLVARLRAGIERGRPAPGERLPPVRALAERLDVAPNTVAKAYRLLEGSGHLEARGREGTFVATSLPRSATDPRARLDEAAAAYARRAGQVGASPDQAIAAVRRALGRATA